MDKSKENTQCVCDLCSFYKYGSDGVAEAKCTKLSLPEEQAILLTHCPHFYPKHCATCGFCLDPIEELPWESGAINFFKYKEVRCASLKRCLTFDDVSSEVEFREDGWVVIQSCEGVSFSWDEPCDFWVPRVQ